MIFTALLIGLCATGLLLVAGYLFGVKRGNEARSQLRTNLAEREQLVGELQGRIAGQKGHPEPDTLREDLGKMLAPLLRQGETVQRLQSQLQGLSQSLEQREEAQQSLKSEMQRYLQQMSSRPADLESVRADMQRILAPIVERDKQDSGLQATVQQLLSPLMQREQLGYELSRLDLGSGTRGELPRLLDNIADKGGFSTVLLSDEAGLPLASNTKARELDRLAGLSSLMLLLVDRMSRSDAPAPRAVLLYDEADQLLINRLFRVSGQRLLLTAVTTGTNISPTALDPALGKLETVLASQPLA